MPATRVESYEQDSNCVPRAAGVRVVGAGGFWRSHAGAQGLRRHADDRIWSTARARTSCCSPGSIRCGKRPAARSACSSATSTDRCTSSTRTTKKFTVYLDFNGNEGKKGIFRKLTILQGYGNGLNGFYLDPDYTRNGKFYTVHIEDPALPGSNLPDNSQCSRR